MNMIVGLYATSFLASLVVELEVETSSILSHNLSITFAEFEHRSLKFFLFLLSYLLNLVIILFLRKTYFDYPLLNQLLQANILGNKQTEKT